MISGVSSSSSLTRTYPPTPEQGAARPGEAQANKPDAKTKAQQQSEQVTISELAATDRKVRAHEAAHLAAAQGLAVSGASFSYTTGPDGQRYATGGEVSIDVSPGRTPQDTLSKAEIIHRAALAPAEPSGKDRQVAAQATRMAAEAHLALMQEQAARYTQGDTPKAGSQIDVAA